MGFLSGLKERSFLFDTQPLELGLKLFPIKRLEAEDGPVNVEGGHYPFSAVSLFHEARALDGLFDIDFVVEYPFVVEEALGLMAICAPTRRIDFDFGHISPPKLSCSKDRTDSTTNGFGFEKFLRKHVRMRQIPTCTNSSLRRPLPL